MKFDLTLLKRSNFGGLLASVLKGFHCLSLSTKSYMIKAKEILLIVDELWSVIPSDYRLPAEGA